MGRKVGALGWWCVRCNSLQMWKTYMSNWCCLVVVCPADLAAVQLVHKVYVCVMHTIPDIHTCIHTYIHTYMHTYIHYYTDYPFMFLCSPCSSVSTDHSLPPPSTLLPPPPSSADSLSALVGLHHQFGSLGVAWTGTDAPVFERSQDKERTTTTATAKMMQQTAAPQQGGLLLELSSSPSPLVQ